MTTAYHHVPMTTILRALVSRPITNLNVNQETSGGMTQAQECDNALSHRCCTKVSHVLEDTHTLYGTPRPSSPAAVSMPASAPPFRATFEPLAAGIVSRVFSIAQHLHTENSRLQVTERLARPETLLGVMVVATVHLRSEMCGPTSCWRLGHHSHHLRAEDGLKYMLISCMFMPNVIWQDLPTGRLWKPHL